MLVDAKAWLHNMSCFLPDLPLHGRYVDASAIDNAVQSRPWTRCI